MNQNTLVAWLSNRKVSYYLLVWVLFFLLTWLFIPTLRIPLLSDDYLWVRDAAAFATFQDFFKSTFALKETDFRYRPLMPTGVRLCTQLSGDDPFCMHLLSFSLHCLNTLLLGRLSFMVTKNRWLAWGAILFFAVYFPHVVSVGWISDLGNPLALFFMLITTMLFLLFSMQSNYVWLGLSWLTFGLAMISKESALALTPILVAWGLILAWKKATSFKRNLLLIAGTSYIGLFGLYLIFVNRTGLDYALSADDNYAYHFDLNTVRNLFYYPLNFIWPTPVSTLEHLYQNLFDLAQRSSGLNSDTLGQALTLPGLGWVIGGALVIWLGVIWLLWRGYLIDWLALAWLASGLGPVIFLAGHGERHFYVASVGLSLLVGHVLARGLGHPQQRFFGLKTVITVIFGAAILGLNLYWSQTRVQSWQIAGRTAQEIITTVTETYPELSPEAEIWFANLPTDYQGAHLFRLGIDAAVQLELKGPGPAVHQVSSPDKLPPRLGPNQYAFVFKDNQLVDLTPTYRAQ